MIQSFNNDTRCIDVQLKIHFESETLVVNKDNYLVSFDVLEELSSDSKNPLGSISSNELDFTLFNTDDLFTPTNESSKYYGEIETNVKVEIEIREELTDSEWVKMGTFYVYDWDCNQGAACVNVTCNDKMQQLLTLPMPIYMVKKDISVHQFLTELLTEVGLKPSQYDIDLNLTNQMLKYAYPLYGPLGDTLSDIATTQLCYIYVDRNEVLCVKSIKTTSNVVDTLTDDNQIIECKVKQTLLQDYSSVIVTYLNKSISEDSLMIELKEQNVVSDVSEFNNLIIENGPMYLPAHCLCEANEDVYVSSISYTPWDISLSVTNTYTQSQLLDISIYGSTINTDAKSYVSDNVPSLISRMGDIPLEIQGEYLDNDTHANNVKDTMIKYISNPTPMVEMYVRGNPYISVGDTIRINNVTNKITNKEVIVLRQDFKFTDGLECTMLCLDKSIVTKAVD